MVKNKRAKQGRIFDPRSDVMHLSSAFPRGGGGGGPRADVGEYGYFMGTLQQISALVEGEMWGL